MAAAQPPNDAELVGRSRAGDRAAFGLLIGRHQARLKALLIAALGSRPEAEDALQEALLQAYLGLERLRDPARFGSWLTAIALDQARMLLRRRPRAVRLWDGLPARRRAGCPRSKSRPGCPQPNWLGSH
ncbi:MAG: RNA polymerase sigma factor [Candidatus Promineifilaceae bacterium]